MKLAEHRQPNGEWPENKLFPSHTLTAAVRSHTCCSLASTLNASAPSNELLFPKGLQDKNICAGADKGAEGGCEELLV